MGEQPPPPPPVTSNDGGSMTRSQSGGGRTRFAPNLAAAATRRPTTKAGTATATDPSLAKATEGELPLKAATANAVSRGRGAARGPSRAERSGGLLGRTMMSRSAAASLAGHSTLSPVSGPFAQGPASARSLTGSAVAANRMRAPSSMNALNVSSALSAPSSLAAAAAASAHGRPPTHAASAPWNAHEATPMTRSTLATDEGDQHHYGIDELLKDRTAHQHLPISLVATTGGRIGKKEQKKDKAIEDESDGARGKVPAVSKIPETDQERIVDDSFVDSRELLNGAGTLMLFQLPACAPVPAMGLSSSEMPNTSIGNSGLLEGPLATATAAPATTTAMEGDKVVDIETFKTLQEQQWRDQQIARQAHKWPIGAEGLLGRLRVHASGKITLLINDTVWQAVASSYRPGHSGSGQQRVVAIDADYHQSFDLGPLTSHYVFIPDPL